MFAFEPSMFPPLCEADEEGFLGTTLTLTAAMLKDAYWHGIFPWPIDESFIPWCSPPRRGVILLEDFHVPASFRRLLHKAHFELRVDTAFSEVIRGCAASPRPGQDGTWITSAIIEAYTALHDAGWVHSFETWNRQTGQLVGGMYGVSLGKVFSGESMFHTETGASKFALTAGAATLASCGAKLLDAEVVTSTTALFGAHEIPRGEFLRRLKAWRDDPLTTETLRQHVLPAASLAGFFARNSS